MRRTEWGQWHLEECQSRPCHLQETWWWSHPNLGVEAVEVVSKRMAVRWLVVVEVEDEVKNVASESI